MADSKKIVGFKKFSDIKAGSSKIEEVDPSLDLAPETDSDRPMIPNLSSTTKKVEKPISQKNIQPTEHDEDFENDEENDEFNAGSDSGSVNDEVNQSDHIANDPIAILLSQATQESGQRISPRLENQNPTTGKRTRKRRPTPDNQDIRHGKRLRTKTVRFAPVAIPPRRREFAPDTDYSPPLVNSSILFPIRVT